MTDICGADADHKAYFGYQQAPHGPAVVEHEAEEGLTACAPHAHECGDDERERHVHIHAFHGLRHAAGYVGGVFLRIRVVVHILVVL